MGGSQSARKITINNEDGVIQISTDLVERLTHSNKNTTTASSSSFNDAGNANGTESSGSNDTQQTITHPVETRRLSPPSAVPQQSHSDPLYPEYTITAYKIQEQKERELEAQDRYWQKRLFNLKLQYEQINKVFLDEYKRAVDEISNAQGKMTIDLDSVVPPCCADKEKVLKCYQENPREILKCSSVVDEFNNCVDQRRSNIIAARG